MAFVLDASVALAWVMPGEHSEAASRLRTLMPAHEEWVPSLWSLEVLNVVALGERQGRFKVQGQSRCRLNGDSVQVAVRAIIAESIFADRDEGASVRTRWKVARPHGSRHLTPS